ncbi:Flp1 family type IVb pilin [Saccharibacillus qingshengii]|uniref:Flp1 family type IVb pilin n=1 Tax=Saccharibacillus qingshengii TaxID=1763540 RepID=UPI0015525BA4|nr:Flp1 family type IVb pilin [Saccharibacillus qingshengii]
MLQVIGSKVKGFWKEEEGLGTLEVILIIGVTLIIALIFKTQITALVNKLLSSVNTKSEEFFK